MYYSKSSPPFWHHQEPTVGAMAAGGEERILNNVRELLMGLEKKLILLGDEVALVGYKLGVIESGEVKSVEGVMDKGQLITNVG